MPVLEQRPVYKSGKSSFALTLPAGWVRYLKINPGDMVELVISDEIVIRPIRNQVSGPPGKT